MQHVVVHADGARESIAPSSGVADPGGKRPAGPAAADAADDGPTVRVPLGALLHARSGDKGGSANVGLWSRQPAVHAWLQQHVTPDTVRRLLPEAAGLDVEVHQLPNLSACNVLIHGLMDDGATSTSRFDAQAKGPGEFLRSRYVDVPRMVPETARAS